MALRQIRVLGDPVLEKKCREVKEMTPRLKELVEDMLETMYHAQGVGLAAPQVGVLRQIVVIDVSDAYQAEAEDAETEEAAEGTDEETAQEGSGLPDHTGEWQYEGPIVLINPVILETSGEQTRQEGCLSVPGKAGDVSRPEYVKVRALNADLVPFEMEADSLLARAVCHELDHLNGVMYVSKVNGELYNVAEEGQETEEA